MTRRRAKRHRSTRSTRQTCPGDPAPAASPSSSQPCPTPQIRDLPPDERPRQRLLRSGAHSLSDAEVLSIILGNGCREVCPLDLARQILEEGDGLFGLVGIHAPMLRRKGLGDSKAASVLASLELAKRLARAEIPRRQPLKDPVAVASYLALKYTVRDQEVVGALYIDVRNRLVGERELYRGTLHRALVEPREIFRDAILRGAAGIVLFHTHPSRDPQPSGEDVAFTRRLAVASSMELRSAPRSSPPVTRPANPPPTSPTTTVSRVEERRLISPHRRAAPLRGSRCDGSCSRCVRSPGD